MERQDIDDLVTAAEQCRGDEAALMRIIDELERGVGGGAEVRYACAYAWYLHPRRLGDAAIQLKVDELLRGVLEEKPGDFLALRYLGHNSYDRGDYVEARRWFEQASGAAPKSYVGLKAHEMRLCSKISLVGLTAAVDELEAFAREASDALRYEKDDIWPKELANLLQRRAPRELSAAVRTPVTELIDLVDRAGDLNGWLRLSFEGTAKARS